MPLSPALPVLALALVAACAADPAAPPPEALIMPEPIMVYTPDPYDDPGYPPQMGTITGVQGDRAVAWTTYDFSVGAYDASAWFGVRDDVVRLTMTGYPPGDPRSDDGLLRITGRVDGPLEAGTAVTEGTLALVDARDWDAPRLSGPATITLEALSRDQETSGYGSISGTFSGTLCPPAGMGMPCQLVTGRFSTRVQFDGL
jgi:hypothetical protein